MGSGPHFDVLRARDARPWGNHGRHAHPTDDHQDHDRPRDERPPRARPGRLRWLRRRREHRLETTPAEETSTSAEEETTPSEEPTEEESGDTEASGDFCTAYDALLDAQTTLSSIDTSDPAAAVTQFETFTASLEAAEAPAEISTDWDNVTGVFRQLTDTLETAVDDPANADISSITSLMTDETFQTSAQNVAVYGTQNC